MQATIPYATGHRPEKDPALHIVEKSTDAKRQVGRQPTRSIDARLWKTNSLQAFARISDLDQDSLHR